MSFLINERTNVLAPEKFVAFAAFGPDQGRTRRLEPINKGGLRNYNLFYLSLFGGVLLDLCGVGALVAMLAGGVLFAALAVGYAATALGGLCLIGLFIPGFCEHCCELCCE